MCRHQYKKGGYNTNVQGLDLDRIEAVQGMERPKHRSQTRATLEAHHFFSEASLILGAYDLSQKLIWRKPKLLPDGNFYGRVTQQESCKTNGLLFIYFPIIVLVG